MATQLQVEFTLGSTLDSNIVESDTGAEILAGIIDASFAINGHDIYEVDDAAASAKAFTVDGGSQKHNFYSVGDVDRISFDAFVGTTYYVFTSNLGAASDTHLSLYDADGATVVATNDDYVPGVASFSFLEWTAPGDGTYYAKLESSDDSVHGPGTHYDLTVSSTKPDWADLKITMLSYEKPDPLPGESLPLSVDYVNTGVISATNTIMTVTIPVHTTYVSSDIDGQPIAPSIDGYDLTFNMYQLGPRSAGYDSLAIRLQIDQDTPPCRELIADARISSDKTDPDLSDNRVQAITRIACRKQYLPLTLKAQ